MLLIGAGVIGSIYAGQLALGGCRVWVLEHSKHDAELARSGIRLEDIDAKSRFTVPVNLAHSAVEQTYDVVLVAVQAEQLASVFPELRRLQGSPHIVFFGNNPSGHALIPEDLPGDYELAFPGVAGGFEYSTVRYVHVDQQATTLEISDNPLSKTVQTILEGRGFSVKRTNSMDGWLAYHAVFIACMLAALEAVDNDPQALGRNRLLLKRLCRAIEEGFAGLKLQQVRGLPRPLAILHLPILRPIAIRYWGNIMCSGRGELYFAAHARHGAKEVEVLRQWALQRLQPNEEKMSHLQELLAPKERP